MVCNLEKFPREKTLLSVDNINFSYGLKQVLYDISFELVSGQLYGLLGPNGSGKSTLFKCCLNFLKPSSGQIILAGENLKKYSSKHLAKHLAYVPQEHQPAFPFTVYEMVQMGRTPHQGVMPILSKHDKKVVEHALDRVGLLHLAKQSYRQLSGGQRQLVMIARALAQEAFLMLLDEPTASLDFSNQLMVWEILKTLSKEGVAIVICTHDPNHVIWFTDQVLAIKDGRLAACGPTKVTLDSELLTTLYDRFVSIASWEGKIFIKPPF